MSITKNVKRVVAIFIFMILIYIIVNWNDIADRFQPRYMSVEMLSADVLETLLAGLEEMPDKPELFFDGYNPAYDTIDGLYYVTQNMENDRWDGLFASSHGSLYWENDSYFTKQALALAEGHVFHLYCVDNENGRYCCYPIVFTGMPTMVIATDTGAPIEDDPQNARMYVSDMKFAGKEYQASDCEVNVRGQTSKSYEKKGYKLKLDRKLSLLGMRRDDDWILSALYDDDGLIHNKFSYDVWRNIASDNSVAKDEGTTMEYVELFCNDTYMGVYGLIERIDAKELSLGKSDIMYKCSGFDLPDETIPEDFGLSASYEIEWPKEHSQDTWMPLKSYLDIFASKQIADYGEYNTARDSLNMENAIDYNIFIILARACDNYVRKNTFFVAENNDHTETGYSIIKIPWDCNATWGDGLYKGNIDRQLYNPDWIYCAYVWSYDIKAMYQYYPDEIQELMLARWKELRQDILSEERLLKMLDEDFNYLHDSGAYDRNYVRWNEHGREHWKDEYIYEYVSGRLEFLDTYFTDIYFDETAKGELDVPMEK